MARRLIQKHGSALPIDVSSVLEHYATVTHHPWQVECDAIVTHLTSPGKPQVFVREVHGRLSRRQRFTLAHELGHIALAWHMGTHGCTMSGGDGRSLATAQPPRILQTSESEANEFAATFLMPHEELAKLAESLSPANFFRALDQFELSPQATVLRVAGLLRPGVRFVGPFADNWTHIHSPGSGPVEPSMFDVLAQETGSFDIDGRTIQWYRLFEDAQLLPDDGSIQTSDLLRQALLNSGENGQSIDTKFRQVSGIISGILSKPRTGNVTDLVALVFQWILIDERVNALKDDPLFRLFVQRKASARSLKLSAS